MAASASWPRRPPSALETICLQSSTARLRRRTRCSRICSYALFLHSQTADRPASAPCGNPLPHGHLDVVAQWQHQEAAIANRLQTVHGFAHPVAAPNRPRRAMGTGICIALQPTRTEGVVSGFRTCVPGDRSLVSRDMGRLLDRRLPWRRERSECRSGDRWVRGVRGRANSRGHVPCSRRCSSGRVQAVDCHCGCRRVRDLPPASAAEQLSIVVDGRVKDHQAATLSSVVVVS